MTDVTTAKNTKPECNQYYLRQLRYRGEQETSLAFDIREHERDLMTYTFMECASTEINKR